MIIGRLSDEEIGEVSQLWEKHYSHEFGLPSLERTLTHLKIRDEKGLVGFGMVKLWAEAIMVLDLDRPKITQAKSLKILMDYAIKASEHYKVEQLYATSVGTAVPDNLREHYGFKDFPRIVLVKDLHG